MPKYIFAYHPGEEMPNSPEEGARHMAKWQAWVVEMGDRLVNPGTPLGPSRIVSSDGVSDDGGANPLQGFSVMSADDMDAALILAQACPFIEMGTIEVAEIKEMP